MELDKEVQGVGSGCLCGWNSRINLLVESLAYRSKVQYEREQD